MAPNNSLWGKLMAQLGESFSSLIPSFGLDPITSAIYILFSFTAMPFPHVAHLSAQRKQHPYTCGTTQT